MTKCLMDAGTHGTRHGGATVRAELTTVAAILAVALLLAGCGALQALDEFGAKHLELWSSNLNPEPEPVPEK